MMGSDDEWDEDVYENLFAQFDDDGSNGIDRHEMLLFLKKACS